MNQGRNPELLPNVLRSDQSQAFISSPFVSKHGERVTLPFRRDSVQSEMWTGDPLALMLSHTGTMLGFLLFNKNPGLIAMIGLGGGSLPKWCYAYLPESRIKVIEISPDVISLRDTFFIPEDNHRFEVLCADGADYIAETFDGPNVILVDGFDHDGQPQQLCSQSFHDDSYHALDPDGVLVVNLCGLQTRPAIERITRSFHQRGLVVLPEKDMNVIVIAAKGGRTTYHLDICHLHGEFPRSNQDIESWPSFCNS